MILEKKRV